MKMITTVLLLATATLASAADWDGLGIKWDLNVLFWPEMQPRTLEEAESEGFEPVGSGGCGGSNNFEGYAYYKDGDYAVTLLFDVNGYIAGYQTGIPISDVGSGFPGSGQIPSLELDGDLNNRYIMTAYFTEPSKICSSGRTEDEYKEDGNGDRLYIQNGEGNYIDVPLDESDLRSPWVEGLCFWSMGKHYWYDISDDIDCDDLFPVFLLYNGGRLNGFGWAFTDPGLKGDYYEHPSSDDFSMFMQSVPQCLQEFETVSTQHIFLDAHNVDNLC